MGGCCPTLKLHKYVLRSHNGGGRYNEPKSDHKAGADTRFSNFQKGGLRPAIRSAGGGGGVLSALDPTRKAGGGVLSASGPIRKAGGGGCCPFKARYEKRRGGCCPALQARYKKRGRGRDCLAEEGPLPYMKGGVATPNPPPPLLDPPLQGALLRPNCKLFMNSLN